MGNSSHIVKLCRFLIVVVGVGILVIQYSDLAITSTILQIVARVLLDTKDGRRDAISL